jgi:inner membrane transporter RhtA
MTLPQRRKAFKTGAVRYFLVSAVFHYLGPAFAVLLFASVDPLGVAWLRIVTAAAVFALWRRPWRIWRSAPKKAALALGITIAAMNTVFYLAIDRLPLATVGAIEFLGPIALAVAGFRRMRNFAALALAIAGVALLTQVRLTGQPTGFVLAFGNCALFVAYVGLSKRISNRDGIDRLALSMMVAAIAITPAAVGQTGLNHPKAVLAGIGVGICSSVIPYACDQLALRTMSRAAFALMLSLLPATATAIGLIVLAQRPRTLELAGVALVVAAVGVHREEEDEARSAGNDGPASIAGLPGDDELRRPDVAGLAPR